MTDNQAIQTGAGTATARILECHELLHHIASFLPWKHLPTLGASSSLLRCIAQLEAEKRIKMAMDPILKAQDLTFHTFMKALDKCEGGFIGSTALRVMYMGTEYEDEYARMPRLTVVVPQGQLQVFTALLNKPSWIWTERPIGWQSRETISKVVEASVQTDFDFLTDEEVLEMVPEPETPEERGNDYTIQGRVKRRERLKRLVCV
ncbi:hypothetical protein CC1G_13030 [Coprinopsis cinerea okayama7|uniref:Uncharacterized protein n=1 Tax=Coprinopsis cinerea (strain Okayama-7 / 130 / ATCC MYA-4618 / FGSC 9003) TaxID=240176 RepID=A8PGV0_COPC7|nr:hypothetical protein CC1G_13030 [Coprinopsis cinerea okayama7\|eukprot:XP_001841287.2 hypothetical protein CC1G_13030 [Coprinopsis cinerea okayama7\